MQLFMTLEDLEKEYKELRTFTQFEKQSISNYLKEGGIIKTEKNQELKFIYPSKDIIKKEVNTIKAEYTKIKDKLDYWIGMQNDSKNFLENGKRKKYLNKTFWKHKIKESFDKKYKEDFEKINLPIDYINDKGIEKIISTFMDNKDYRNNLLETINNSIIYKNSSLGDKIIKKNNLQKEISEKKIITLQSRKNKLEERITFYKIITKYT